MTAEALAHYQALAARWVAEENGDMLVAVLASLVGAALGIDVVRASWLCEAAGWPAKPDRYTGVIDLSEPAAREALADASAHVWRQQHAGRHTQDRVDAMAWRERFGIHGRCKCDTCERLWQKSRPA